MTAEPVKITLFDLDHADVRDISRELATQSPGLTPETVPGSRYGEPTMLVLAVAFAVPTVQALATWALKNRRKQRIELRAKVLYSDGSEVDRSAIISFSESEAPDAQVIKQLIDGLGLQGLAEGDGDANP